MVGLETGNMGKSDLLYEPFHYVMLESIGALLSIIAFIFIVSASIKLNRGNDIPGAKLIFFSLVFTLLGAVISAAYIYVFAVEESLFFEATISTSSAVAFLAGSYGFWRLAKHIVQKTIAPVKSGVCRQFTHRLAAR